MSNYDEKTGIAYGVISPHAINPYTLDDIYTRGTDPYYENGKKEFEDGLKKVIREYCDNNANLDIADNDIDIDSIMDQWNDNYTGPEDGTIDYSDTEYTLHVSGDNFGIFVIKSPYYTYCRPCSPCAPGAGDLNSPYIEWEDMRETQKVYCLGKDYFEDEKAPYRIFRVDNDQEVV
ncbi:MAG: hypothetical protein PHT77_05430 [Bacteroidales bacterium]|nr:hypothetical protein [Bacteroidales bacterium]